MHTQLILQDGSKYAAENFGAPVTSAGEVVFSTGMTGYPESLTDPSYKGQILILTYPLIGNYGVPDKSYWESERIQVSGLVVSNYIDTPSHFQSKKTLAQWFKDENLPLIEIKDTRALTQKIREHGVMLGKIITDKEIDFYDPDKKNLVAQVSAQNITFQKSENPKAKTILLIDCGAKKNIQRELLKRGVNVLTVPWNTDIFSQKFLKLLVEFPLLSTFKPTAVLISNGPGNPENAQETIDNIKKILEQKIPVLGICLGHQLLSLAAGGTTKKLKYGHRSQNQPCIMEGTKRCYITTQNHGYAVEKIPKGFKKWFTNANDGSNEGIIHEKLPFMSVQFHPEAAPGPTDAEWVFDFFLKKIHTDS